MCLRYHTLRLQRLSYSGLFLLLIVGVDGYCGKWKKTARTHTRTHTRTEGLLWTKDRDLYLTIHSTQNRLTSMPSVGCGIRTLNPRKEAVADPHLRPRGQRHRPICTLEAYVYMNFDRPFMVSSNIISVFTGMQPVLHRTFVFTSFLACSSSSVDPISSSSSKYVSDGFASYLYTCTGLNLHLNGTHDHIFGWTQEICLS
jgi:hypothetical protein